MIENKYEISTRPDDVRIGDQALWRYAGVGPRREPTLERAMPADAVPGSTIPERTEAHIQLRDGSWIWCEVIGQRKDRGGRWCIGLRWYASPSIDRQWIPAATPTSHKIISAGIITVPTSKTRRARGGKSSAGRQT